MAKDMKMQSRWLVCAALLVGLSGCKTAEQALLERGVMPMHEAQMREEFVGKTLYGETESGKRWIEYLDENGTARTKWVDSGALSKGNWTIKEFLSCFSYGGKNAGIPFCYRTYRDGENIIAYKDSKHEAGQLGFRIYRIEQGNVEGL